MKVHTTKGELDIDLLEVTDVTTLEPNARVTATEWRLDGEIVRRDVHVNILSAQVMNGAQGGFHGQ